MFAAGNRQNLFFRPPQMSPVLFVLLARVRHDFRILARDWQRDRPGLREKFGIFKCYGPFDGVIVHLLKPFDQMQLVAVLVARRVEPGPVVQPHGVHHQCVSVPFADGIPKPRRIRNPSGGCARPCE